MNRIFLLVACLVLFFPVSGHAWEQSMTCGEEYACKDYDPLPTYWKNPCVSFYLNEEGTSHIAKDDVIRVVKKSIEAWNHPEVSSLESHYSGLTDEDRIGYNPYIQENANIIVFRDKEWNESPAMMALTSVIQRNSTGEIYDADIEINTADYRYGIFEQDGSDVVDLENTLTHEIGHVFGLGHSLNTKATMFPYSGTGEIGMRDLDEDDLEAIHAIYPPGQLACQFADGYFKRPLLGMKEAPPKEDSGCRVHWGQPAGNVWHLVFGCLVLMGLIHRGRRGRSSE